MFFRSKSKEQNEITWNILEHVHDLDELDQHSHSKPVLLFKHSTRCSISAMALSRFERQYHNEANFDIYFLDLIARRDVSDSIEDRYGIRHESPQVILVKGGKAVYHNSHNGIDFDEINHVSLTA